jgi:tetratricopeptide (TPR) repeat protein
MNQKLFVIFILLNCYVRVFSLNQHKIDSLQHIIQTSEIDTIIFWGHIKKAEYFLREIPDSALNNCEKALFIAQKTNYKKGIGEALGWLAYIESSKGNINQAIDYNKRAILIFGEINDRKNKATTLSNLAMIYRKQGLAETAMESYLESLKVFEELQDSNKTAGVLNNMGAILKDIGDYRTAINYFNQALTIKLSIKQLPLIEYNNIGFIYNKMNKNDSALYFYRLGLSGWLKINRMDGIGAAYNNIAYIHEINNQIDSAFYYYRKSLTIRMQIGEKAGIASTKTNLANVYLLIQQPDSAIYLTNDALKLSLETNNMEDISAAYNTLHQSYILKNNYEKAITFFKLHRTYLDSVVNEQKTKDISKTDTKFKLLKKQEADKQIQKELEMLEERKKERRNSIQYSMIFLGILLVFGVVLGSGKFNISPKFAEGLIFFAFLIFFEFCLVLLDPIIDDWSRGEPVYKLFFNAILAGAIFPLHTFFERLLKQKIILK